jgi:predicted N-formylglutamate amidohydrolase
MAIKDTEVMLSLLYHDTSDPDNPRGGTTWVCRRGFAELPPALGKLGMGRSDVNRQLAFKVRAAAENRPCPS